MKSDDGPSFDVVIVGAGPAGSSCAIRLADRGLSVLLVEQKRFPREKLCGEFISPECLTHFAELGVLDQISATGGSAITRTTFFARNGRSVSIRSEWFADGGHALGLSRREMDAALLGRARAVGVDVREEARAVGLVIEQGIVKGGKLRSGGETDTILAKLTIDATGRARAVARFAEPRPAQSARAKSVAFKVHLAGADVPDDVCEIYSYRGGYGGCNRVEGDRHNLCFIVNCAIARDYRGDARHIMRDVVCSNRRAGAVLARAEVAGDWLAVPIVGYGRSSLTPAPGLIAVGDAAAFNDPFTGSGILLALEGGRLASDVVAARLADSSPDALIRLYRERFGAMFDTRLRVSSLVRRAAFVPLLADSVISCLATSDRLSRFVARATRRAETRV